MHYMSTRNSIKFISSQQACFGQFFMILEHLIVQCKISYIFKLSLGILHIKFIFYIKKIILVQEGSPKWSHWDVFYQNTRPWSRYNERYIKVPKWRHNVLNRHPNGRLWGPLSRLVHDARIHAVHFFENARPFKEAVWKGTEKSIYT